MSFHGPAEAAFHGPAKVEVPRNLQSRGSTDTPKLRFHRISELEFPRTFQNDKMTKRQDDDRITRSLYVKTEPCESVKMSCREDRTR